MMNDDKLIRLGDVLTAVFALIDQKASQEGISPLQAQMAKRRYQKAIAALPAAVPAVRVRPLVWLLRETGWNAYCALSERTYTAFSEGQKREIEAVRAARILAALDLTPAPAPDVAGLARATLAHVQDENDRPEVTDAFGAAITAFQQATGVSEGQRVELAVVSFLAALAEMEAHNG